MTVVTSMNKGEYIVDTVELLRKEVIKLKKKVTKLEKATQDKQEAEHIHSTCEKCNPECCYPDCHCQPSEPECNTCDNCGSEAITKSYGNNTPLQADLCKECSSPTSDVTSKSEGLKEWDFVADKLKDLADMGIPIHYRVIERVMELLEEQKQDIETTIKLLEKEPADSHDLGYNLALEDILAELKGGKA